MVLESNGRCANGDHVAQWAVAVNISGHSPSESRAGARVHRDGCVAYCEVGCACTASVLLQRAPPPARARAPAAA